MTDENQLNPGHNVVRQVLRIVGPLTMAAGLVFTAIGLASFFSSFGSFGPPRYFWCAFIGLPLTGVGAAITKFAYMGSILRYFSAEAAPVGKDTFNYMASGTRQGVRDVVSAVREGLSGGEGECPQCRHKNDVDARFCDNCGQPLAATKTCPACLAENDSSARFCNDCGNAFAVG